MYQLRDLSVWGTDIDYNTLIQAEVATRVPVVVHPVALMADAHIGIGATVGSVIPTRGAIIPSAVGVDIGCGMASSHTDLTASDLPDDLQPLVYQLSRSIPSGVGRGRNTKSIGIQDMKAQRRAESWMTSHPYDLGPLAAVSLAQLGSLGSGNHFVEVCLDETDAVWVILHSGSRNVGNRLASNHIALARSLELGLEDRDLGYFMEGTPEFQHYISDMLWCQNYALENRNLMMEAALHDLFSLVGHGGETFRINCHHNFAALENHHGEDLWVTRKGAIRAEVGDWGLIPGSMGTGSYVVSGLGNPLSYNSASHGAGRRMSRGQAKRELTQESLVEMMKGKAWNRDSKGLLDEHPQAYKDVHQVMQDQADLVRVEHVLTQVLNYKGI